MKFLPELKEFLRKNGRVFTVRRYKYRKRISYVNGVGYCKAILVKEAVAKGDLGDHVHLSGFSSVDDWWSKVIEFNPDLPTLYLYEVEVLNV